MRQSGAEAARAVAMAAAVTCVASPAAAGGFALFEQGARAMGFANAFTAQAGDAIRLTGNPGGSAKFPFSSVTANHRCSTPPR